MLYRSTGFAIALGLLASAASAQAPPAPTAQPAPAAAAPTPMPLAKPATTPATAKAAPAAAAPAAAKAAPTAAAAPAAKAPATKAAAPKKCMRLPLSDIAVGRDETIAQARMRLGEYAEQEAKTRKWGALTKSLETVTCEVYLVLPLIGTEYKCLVTATFCTK